MVAAPYKQLAFCVRRTVAVLRTAGFSRLCSEEVFWCGADDGLLSKRKGGEGFGS